MINNEHFERLFKQNEKVIKLLAAIAIQDKNFREQIQLLSDVGLSSVEISEIIGKDVNTIRVTKTLMKQKNGKKK